MLKKILKPSGEKILMASAPFFIALPVFAYVVFGFFFNLEASAIGRIFSAAAFFCYSFIALFAIPFEGFFSLLGMLEAGGGIFENGILGIDFAGIILAQAFYSLIFYVIFSVRLFMKSGKKMRNILGARN